MHIVFFPLKLRFSFSSAVCCVLIVRELGFTLERKGLKEGTDPCVFYIHSLPNC